MEETTVTKTNKSRIGLIFGILGATFGFIILFVIGYVGIVFLSYSRIGNISLEIDHASTLLKAPSNTELTAMTYNIGFGAYSQDYTFFMDEGFDEEGNATCGKQGTAKSYGEVLFNMNGVINTTKSVNPDFMLYQEVDLDSTRSYRMNQDKMIQESFASYDHVFAKNFHSMFLPYPLYDMHGAVQSGLSTFSRYRIIDDSAKRVEYVVPDGLAKIFDLDRCFSIKEVEVDNGKHLYIINSHMSAYDSTGLVREKQLNALCTALEEISSSGNYFVVGGDFNHDLLTYNPMYKIGEEFKYTKTNKPFNEKKKDPSWVSPFFKEDGSSPLSGDFTVYAADNAPTVRNNDIPSKNGKTYVNCIDGFICSNNVLVTNTEVVATNGGNLGTDYFAFSDHQPVKITFKLI